MDVDVSLEDAELIAEILANYGPADLTERQEEFLDKIVSSFLGCSAAGCTLHFNF